MNVDLRQCKPGDKLLTRQGTTLVLEYVGLNKGQNSKKYPHVVKYPTGHLSTRTDSGETFNSECLSVDIVEILK